MDKISREELAARDGSQGPPIYVAYEGKVYDVTDSALWDGGDHQGEHTAGHDLTEEIFDAPHEPDVLEDYPVVGELGD